MREGLTDVWLTGASEFTSRVGTFMSRLCSTSREFRRVIKLGAPDTRRNASPSVSKARWRWTSYQRGSLTVREALFHVTCGTHVVFMTSVPLFFFSWWLRENAEHANCFSPQYLWNIPAADVGEQDVGASRNNAEI